MKPKHIRHLLIAISVAIVCAGFVALLLSFDESFPFRGRILLSAFAGCAGFGISISSPVQDVPVND